MLKLVTVHSSIENKNEVTDESLIFRKMHFNLPLKIPLSLCLSLSKNARKKWILLLKLVHLNCCQQPSLTRKKLFRIKEQNGVSDTKEKVVNLNT